MSSETSNPLTRLTPRGASRRLCEDEEVAYAAGPRNRMAEGGRELGSWEQCRSACVRVRVRVCVCVYSSNGVGGLGGGVDTVRLTGLRLQKSLGWGLGVSG